MSQQTPIESSEQSANSFRQLAAFVAITVLAAAGLNIHWKTDSLPSASPSQPDQLVPDTIVEQPWLDTFDESGRKIRQLRGQQIQHFEKSKRSDVRNPVVQFEQQSADQPPTPWEITADTATIYQSNNRVDLQGNVHLWSDATRGGRTEILTEQLLVDTSRQFAETDKAVTIRTHGSEAKSTGLQADLAKEHVLLPSRVKEIHEARH